MRISARIVVKIGNLRGVHRQRVVHVLPARISNHWKWLAPVLLGALWCSRSIQSYSDPSFTHPQTVADWWAVVSFSLALLLVPFGLQALLGLTEEVGTRIRILCATCGVASAAAGVGSFLDDGLGVDAGGIVFAIGVVIAMAGLLAVGFTLASRAPRWPGIVAFATFAGLVGLDSGGGILILGAWVSVAIMSGDTWVGELARPIVRRTARLTRNEPAMKA